MGCRQIVCLFIPAFFLSVIPKLKINEFKTPPPGKRIYELSTSSKEYKTQIPKYVIKIKKMRRKN